LNLGYARLTDREGQRTGATAGNDWAVNAGCRDPLGRFDELLKAAQIRAAFSP